MAETFPSFDLSTLTPRQREVIDMHYASGLSFRAIAQVLGLHHTTVYEHHEAAIARLRASDPNRAQQGLDA
jgi:RNA polymerase sigma factor (sigma-70 family)